MVVPRIILAEVQEGETEKTGKGLDTRRSTSKGNVCIDDLDFN